MTLSLTEEALNRSRRFWAPPPKLTVSEWADKYRQLSKISSAEHGQWRTSRTPYLREVMDCASDLSVRKIVLQFGAQLGKSEACNNIVGYYIHQDPSPILFVQPTIQTAEKYSKKRIAPMIADSPVLAELVNDPSSRNSGNTILEKEFPGGHLNLVGANAPAGLASQPIRIDLNDEIDRYPESAGTEGDPIYLGEQRTTTFWNSLIVSTSTPTLEGLSKIEAAYQDSDQRQYWVTCPHCKKRILLLWRNPHTEEYTVREGLYHCQECGAGIEDKHKVGMLRDGSWIAQKEFQGIAGFHLNSLYSPWRTFEQLEKEFRLATKDKKKLQVFVNTRLAETWQDKDKERTEGQIQKLRDDRPAGIIPGGGVVQLVTAAADTQALGFWYEIRAWGHGENLESWQVKAGFVESFEALETVLWGSEYKDTDGHVHVISNAVIDCLGDKTQAVYDWTRKHRGKVYPLKGEQYKSQPYSWSNIYYYPGKGGKKIPIPGGGVQLILINTTYYKDALASKLEIVGSDPGAWHMNADTSDEWCRQMTAEFKDPEKQVWKCPKGRANHAWDCSVYAMAQAELLNLKFRKKVLPRQENPPKAQHTVNKKKSKEKRSRW